MIKSLWLRLQVFFAARRVASIAVLSPFPVIFLNLAINQHNNWFFTGSIISYILLIVAATAPQHYARIILLETIQSSIHKVLGLPQTDRVAIHTVHSKKIQRYEQLTNYYPTKVGRGRVYNFSEGIVGRCFKTKRVHTYTIPQGMDFITAIMKDWAFTRDEAMRLSQDRRSYFTFPVGEDSQYARVVLYIDSDDPNKFTLETENTFAEKIRELFLPQLEQIVLE